MLAAFQKNSYPCGGTALAALQINSYPCGVTALAAFQVNSYPCGWMAPAAFQISSYPCGWTALAVFNTRDILRTYYQPPLLAYYNRFSVCRRRNESLDRSLLSTKFYPKILMVVFVPVSSVFIFVHSHINQACIRIILFPEYGSIKRFKMIHTMSALIDLAFFQKQT